MKMKVHYPPTYPVVTSHIFMVLSLEADTMWSPFGMMATDETLWSWPGNTDKDGFCSCFEFISTENNYPRVIVTIPGEFLPCIVLMHSKP